MENWRSLYPFESRYHILPGNHRMHYIDCGSGVPVVMLHGIPTWSFMYRDVIARLQHSRRCIAPDNLGCGLSDKPQDWPYRLENHIDNLEHFINSLNLDTFDMIVHDWGGAIGMGYAVRHPEKLRRIILMNTAAFLPESVPKAIHLVRAPFLGALLTRGANALVRTALRKAVAHPMPPDVRAAYAFPYGNWHDRIATQRFAQDIPLSPSHPSFKTFLAIQEALPCLASRRILICWGEKDFCFPMQLFQRWRKIYPGATAVSFPDAAHYILEDIQDKLIPLICNFLHK